MKPQTRLAARKWLAHMLRFGVVGLMGTLIYAVLAFTLVALGITLWIAHLVSSVLSMLASYLGQKIFTFGFRGGHRRWGPRYVLASAFLFGTHFLLVVSIGRLSGTPQLALICGIIYFPAASYLVHTFWTFRHRASQGALTRAASSATRK